MWFVPERAVQKLVEATNSDPKRISCLGLVFVATMALISIFNRSWLVGHRSTTAASNEKPTETEMSALRRRA